MPNFDSMHMDYAKYRLERAKDDLDTAHLLYELLATYINEKVEEK